jgi:hypothetical protein
MSRSRAAHVDVGVGSVLHGPLGIIRPLISTLRLRYGEPISLETTTPLASKMWSGLQTYRFQGELWCQRYCLAHHPHQVRPSGERLAWPRPTHTHPNRGLKGIDLWTPRACVISCKRTLSRSEKASTNFAVS